MWSCVSLSDVMSDRSSISFNPADESITKVLRQSLGPIVCSAQCNPHCQFHWIKPDGTVVDRPNIEIPRLSKNDHGTFTCHYYYYYYYSDETKE
jgi:hypothetical protein